MTFYISTIIFENTFTEFLPDEDDFNRLYNSTFLTAQLQFLVVFSSIDLIVMTNYSLLADLLQSGESQGNSF